MTDHSASLALLKKAQRDFCMARFQMGALLQHIKDVQAWQGRATSFASFLEEERINDSAAYQYMRIAKKFFYELCLSESDFERLADCNMVILDLACQVITTENKDEIIGILSILSERDARQTLLELIEESEILPSHKPKKSAQVNRVLAMFKQLPDDQRIEFFNVFKEPAARESCRTSGNC